MNAAIGAPEKQVWLERMLYVALLLVCVLALSKNQPDPDFWGHVQYGRDLLLDGLPDTTTYSYTTIDHRWINHENLSELAFAVGVDKIGPEGLLCIKCLLGLLLMGAVMRQAVRRGVSQSRVVVVALLVSLNLMHFWVLRPQLFSYILFALVVLLVDWVFADWRDQWRLIGPRRRAASASLGQEFPRQRMHALWLLPVLFAVWANTHGGFVAGYGLLAVYFACRSLEAVTCLGSKALPRVGCLLAVLAVTGLATCANPYGLELHAWLLQSLATPRPEIIEWRAPEFARIAWLPWWLLAGLGLASVVFSRRPRDFTHLMILLLMLWQAVEHRRHIPFFTILFGFWLAVHLDDFARRFGARTGDIASSAAESRLVGRLMSGSLIGICLLVATTLQPQLAAMPVLRCDYPVSALAYLSDHKLEGKLVTRFKWAQYAIAAVGTQSPEQGGIQVAFDGRFRTCYPPEVVDMYFDFALGANPEIPRARSPHSGSINAERILEFRHPDLVLIDRRQRNTVETLDCRRDQWVLLYQDELAQLWGRAERYADPHSPDFIPPAQRKISDEQQVGYVAWPAFSTETPLRGGLPVARRPPPEGTSHRKASK